MKHTLVATMEDGPAVLNRVVSLFRQRGFAIDSLTIGKTHEQHVMRLTMVIDGSKTAVEQVVKQLYKVIEVRKVSDLTEDQTVERELALIKVTSKSAALRAEILQMVDVYVVPAANTYFTQLAAGATAAKALGVQAPQTEIVDRIGHLLRVLMDRRKALSELFERAQGMHDEEAKAVFFAQDVSRAMVEVRHAADELEGIVADDLWPVPKYREMLFLS